MTDFPWLSAALLLPILGAVVVALLPARDGDLPKKVAFGFSLLTLVLVALIGVGFDTGGDRYQFTETTLDFHADLFKSTDAGESGRGCPDRVRTSVRSRAMP